MKILFVVTFFLLKESIWASQPCQKRIFNSNSFVCVCNATYCDTIDPLPAQTPGSYLLYTSDSQNLRFSQKSGSFVPQNANIFNPKIVRINRNDKRQSIYGWGGAFTDATGINLVALSDKVQDLLLQSYFGEKGIEYNFARVPIGGTDFSTHAYSYSDGPEDVTLSNFNLTIEDYRYKIPFIKKSNEIRKDRVSLLASAWTAPKWMKSNGKYTGGAIKDGYFDVWAKYYKKFFEAYAQEGLDFWGVTTGNEPSLALVNSAINSVGFSVLQMKEWIGDHLGPTLKNSKFNTTKILTLDDQRFFLPWLPVSVIDSKVKEFIDGIAIHWYWDNLIPPELIDWTQIRFPNLFIFATESCRGSKFWETAVLLGDWDRAEDYAHGIIQDLNHNVVGWIDWNMALNMSGGPTYIGNEVDSPIIVNQDEQEFYKQPMFYAIGHFSKFIPKGSIRITYDASIINAFEITTFERPDKGIVVILHNRKNTVENVIIRDTINGDVELNINPKSINSLIYW